MYMATISLPAGARVGTRLALDWGSAGWREGVCTAVSTELGGGGKSVELFQVEYDDDSPRLAKRFWHGRERERRVIAVRIVGEHDSTAEVVASGWESLPLKCQISHARLMGGPTKPGP